MIRPIGRRCRLGAVRIEYLAAAIICVALLVGMTAVLMRYSQLGAGSTIAHRTFEEEPQQRVTPSGTPPIEPRQQESSRQNPPSSQRPQVIVTEVTQTPDPNPTRTGARSAAYPSGEPRVIAASGRTRIEAENYDLGGEGVGYRDTTSENSGGTYRPDDGVDISLSQDSEGDNAVSFIRLGEWLNYTVRVSQSGSYRVRIRASRKDPGQGKLRVTFDGSDKTGVISLPNTGDYSKYVTTDVGTIELAAGEQSMRLEMAADDFNLNWVEFVGSGAAETTIVRVQPIEPGQPRPDTPTVQVQVTDDSRPVASETFDEVKAGQRPVGDSWTWSNSGSVAVQQTPGGNDRCLRLVDISRTGDCWARQSFPAQKETVIWHARVRFSAAADQFGISLVEGDRQAVFLYTEKGELGYADGDGKWQSLAKFEANTWYDLRIEANVKDDTFRLFVDNVQRGDSNLKFRNNVNEINAWVGGTSPQLVGTMYIDNVKIGGR